MRAGLDGTKAVIRRTGGLEGNNLSSQGLYDVIRRTGGLEGSEGASAANESVIRRTGGLEAPVHQRAALAVSYPPHRRLRSTRSPAGRTGC